ncbi:MULTISPECIES: alpha-1,4-glucan--maltose-1-phosphate maltosyltransferase [unclassified Microbacterium]|uniref:alpha-1,4-glucan--maltose-1-phosphate maltosyltransferase n=1 Tax=unclassified Microbacterium TaxID=2609290 RepID=UPI001604B47B|nr:MULTISPECIES: alpha-1,4-glucan--maltose-1-phosphate maltosyltransferase [unclassified Microbacterium]QNA92560.1 alpha-1,4-glucan--maltose-1-phosphate maltosyltransferase [Microbacterium sp. Se63.02b]QYM65858.1 alpha-1,4-glucan--maltose-1-phosphate maltosyltransferase [Microbacterium sp. Se5.02b]
MTLRSPSQIPPRAADDADTPGVLRTTRIPLLQPSPAVPGGFTPKAFVGEVVPFSVTSFREGHDIIGVHVRLTSPSGEETLHRLSPRDDGTDTWSTDIALDEQGAWRFRFEAFSDDFATWAHAAELKVRAAVDVPVMAALGADLLARAATEKDRPAAQRKHLGDVALALRSGKADTTLAVSTDARLVQIFRERPVTSLRSASSDQTVNVDRLAAGTGAWYEFFPRSEGARRLKDGTVKSGTFRTAMKRLPEVAAMGFDVVYLVPVHPIGTTHRKGRNNTLVAEPGDPGSPYAIGSAAGGHDAIHPDLGTPADFRAFVRAAQKEGLEVALDLALQASPDHPWVSAHPEWFTTLPDGTIAFAENPPKKYQDIYPLNFDNDPEGIAAEMLRIVQHWVGQGVKIFRVDNPHTKPLQFWEWLIAEVNAVDPDVIFLAEAFTRPAVMRALAAVGFQQSYSYFTWRNTKTELEEFLTSVSHETADYMRPNLFVNTHDILTEYLQFGGRAAYRIRACIAATAGPVYGVYAGYELFENVARPGSEENIDNEKYEYKFRDWNGAEARGESLAPLLRRLNEIRRDHPALRQLRTFSTHWSDDDAVLVYSKHLDAPFTGTGRADTIIVVANVDPHSVRETTVHLDTTRWGVPLGDRFEVEDLLTGAVWTWSDHNYVRLDAFAEPVHILKVRERS